MLNEQCSTKHVQLKIEHCVLFIDYFYAHKDRNAKNQALPFFFTFWFSLFSFHFSRRPGQLPPAHLAAYLYARR
ncbi:MAG TPA: hypothetical protein PLH62_06570, partial [Ferruginibacter sp.]|nr:hypothetical protein [Ferruginibacter sp.]